MYIYIHIYTHTHTHIYIYIVNPRPPPLAAGPGQDQEEVRDRRRARGAARGHHALGGGGRGKQAVCGRRQAPLRRRVCLRVPQGDRPDVSAQGDYGRGDRAAAVVPEDGAADWQDQRQLRESVARCEDDDMLTPTGYPPHTHGSRHGPQRTQHTTSTVATPRYPQGRRQTPAERADPTQSVYARPFRRAQTQG